MSIRKLSRESKKRQIRDREPSRVPQQKIMRIMSKRKLRKKVKQLIKKSLPKSSGLYLLANSYKQSAIIFNHRKYGFLAAFGLSNIPSPFIKEAQQIMFKAKLCLACLVGKYVDCQTWEEAWITFDFGNTNHVSQWDILVGKLALIGLLPLNVGGGGSRFFKSCAHQLYGKPESHHEIRMAGVNHLHKHPELYVESFGADSWQTYIQDL